MKFTKMHGCGNDYVYVNLFEETITDPEKLAIAVSDRHFGIGSDGLITIGPSDVADFRMRIYNADGSEAEMCGNGIRCVAKYVYDHGLTDQKEISVESGAGIKYLKLTVEDGVVTLVRVDMGEPILTPAEIPVKADGDKVVDEPIEVGGRLWKMTCVSMGNPHAITVVENTKEFDVETYGKILEVDKVFPNKTNVEFVEIIGINKIKVRVWERGVGETLACGTGACATAVACNLNGLTDRKVNIELLGGTLNIEWNETDNHVYMTGPAVTVFEGEF